MQTAGIYMLTLEHADAIQRLAADPEIAATTRIPHPYPADGARVFIEQQLKERAEGNAYVFAIQDRGELVGACGLHGVANGHAQELGFWVGRAFWGKGYATFAVKMVLQFAFNNLRLERVLSGAFETNAASRRVLEKSGFQLVRLEPHHDPLLKRSQELLAIYEITRPQWRAFCNGPALTRLHPALKEILRAELAAGNEVAETGGGWPDKDSVFVRLRDPFRTHPALLPDGVVFTQLNDPHWWKADYTTSSPRHLLAC